MKFSQSVAAVAYAVAASAQEMPGMPDMPTMPAGGAEPVPFGPKPAGCASYEIIVARGTSEPGPYGQIVGDPLIKGITTAVPSSRGYAVQYPADRSEKSVPDGVDDIVARLMDQDKACPMQKFALVGYSQGAVVMHEAASKIPEDIMMNKIMALVMFGDPALKKEMEPLPAPLQARIFENCAVGDKVCTEGTEIAPHLSYNDPGTPYMPDSVMFVVHAFEGEPLAPRPMAPLPGEGPTTPPMMPPMPPTSPMSEMPGMPTPSMDPGMPGMPTMTIVPAEPTGTMGSMPGMMNDASRSSLSQLGLIMALPLLMFWQ